MHELPKELNKSLRSWRGSVVREGHDVEKGEGDAFLQDAELRGTSSSLVLHPTKSSQALHNKSEDDVHRQQWNRQDQHGTKQEGSAPSNPLYQQPAPSTRNTASRLASPVEAHRQTTFNTSTSNNNNNNNKSLFDQPKVSDPDGAASRLDDDPTPLTATDFYELLGMHPPPSENANNLPAFPKNFAVTNGLYARIRQSYDHLKFQYRAFDIMTYTLMILQLLLSAVFIILGSISTVDSHLPIAILGALSTVIAGSLALMKGQGLPNRLRQGCDGLQYVLFEAEELYWDLGAGREILFKDVKKVREDYLRVMEEQRVNHPDTWNSCSNSIAAGIRPKKSGIPMSKSLVSVGK